MRNPLSAILQSSDTVLQCLIRAKQKLTPVISPPELDDALEAIHTVMLCSNHQKRIIDDTLTMSKLDSRLLLVTPVDTQPVKVVEKAMKMFENDFANKDITAQLIVDPSYDALGIDWVKADPSRFTQVLVNLLSNGTQPVIECTNCSDQVYCRKTSAEYYSEGRSRIDQSTRNICH
jgi:signal transduction histidine kinase